MCNKRPCKCECNLIPVANSYAAIADGPVGAFAISSVSIEGKSYAQLRVKLPNECGQYHALPLYQCGQPHPANVVAWKWDGNLEHPTLWPSIRTRLPGQRWLNRTDDDDSPCTDADMEESWHGYIVAGRAQMAAPQAPEPF